MDVLIDKKGGRVGQVTGRSPFMQSVYLEDGETHLGQIVTVTIKHSRQNSLLAEIVDRPKKETPEENVA